MNAASRHIQRVYLTLLLFNTLAASLIWGINTLFLLDAGLSATEAFIANAFFTAGLVIFEIPTGVIADVKGRRASYLLGTLTLAVTTLLYLLMWHVHAPFWAWALTSAFLGLGFTFFSGAVEAWLVDALTATGFKGVLESVFAKGEIVRGAAMLVGSVAGGFIAQISTLGVPYIVRVVLLVATFLLALFVMRDLGFSPSGGKTPLREVKDVLVCAFRNAIRQPSVKWVMLSGFFTFGVMAYVFYAMQPYLLELYGDQHAYGIAGIAAAIVAAAQIIGGLTVSAVGNVFKRRTNIMLVGCLLSVVTLLLIGFVNNFWVVISLFAVWSFMFAATTPVRQAYLNGFIASKERATVLSFDSLLGSSGGVISQPLLGRSADVWSYQASYLVAGVFQAPALIFTWLARRHDNK
ncbi:MAG TPA: MFS transporter [Candidatus Saccharimonadales bacterium]